MRYFKITKNITKKENIPSHLLLGAAMLFLIMPTSLPLWFKYTFASFSAIGLGMVIELVQVKWFDGTGNERDVRWTWYGYFLAIPASVLSESIGHSDIANYITAAACFVIAYGIHNMHKK